MNQLKKKSPAKFSAGKQKRKSREELNAEGRERKRQKKHSGHPSGNRNHGNDSNKNRSGDKEGQDPRIGSKVPVPLIIGEKVVVKPVVEKPKASQKPRLSPQEELAMLEQDEHLDELLARLEKGEELSQEENAYVDEKLDRIDELMEALGINLEEDDSEEEKKEDIMQLLKGK
ncbi:Der GTPase-activating protein YihI [Xenorhabdus bovienii]|uniref:Der GTPase-activating protein YihI n=1 Tax=Xenorhabdus bovienii str. Intermedium TaxID=1379677 RepID=A0A077QL91_XENBV|nr:Der GTPase-activating protein YihI [Xenorhabdus bovienii]MDE9480455.1 Der GTPase-activating protein YihI [Xenorhabdus bovienii]MDE9543060.1 Der GTPase-activating protein YihI [Xenorhabdus bovienii]MDE9551588.1 Der GTPase-activating protein YihI [Xenorhabdus bovienii]CDH33983.1 conserved hypothetical protein [Xenorhabdus bovienii str. Intermedium]